jgi:two-component system response regulator DesR
MHILLADDQHSVRSALRLLLQQEADWGVVSEAVNAQELFDQVRVTAPDVVLLDWELPGLDSQIAVTALRELRPCLSIIALSGRPEARQPALDAGVEVFVSKGDPPEQVLAAVHSCAGAGRGR